MEKRERKIIQRKFLASRYFLHSLSNFIGELFISYDLSEDLCRLMTIFNSHMCVCVCVFGNVQKVKVPLRGLKSEKRTFLEEFRDMSLDKVFFASIS